MRQVQEEKRRKMYKLYINQCRRRPGRGRSSSQIWRMKTEVTRGALEVEEGGGAQLEGWERKTQVGSA